ncbi:short chain dehydrogenase family protein [Mycobacterium avium subsp. avium 2285 (R)]|nr:short chain dehydrogenase family protein [Mycobacterium avium subsp. avium 2285 (R)]
MRALVAAVVDRFGGIDILVNNAGAGTPAPAVDEELDAFRSSLELNLVAVFNLSRLVAAPMLEAGRGSIINISSIFGLGSSWPIPNGAYTAAKGGVVNLTRELGCQWAERGVRVNALAPGFFPAESTRDVTESEEGTAYVTRRTPMRRTGKPHELDGALMFLASDASSFMTGQTITVDGGWSAH